MRRDAIRRVQPPSLRRFEHLGQESGHLWSLVDEGPDISLRFGQRQGLCQGAHRPLFLTFCSQGQCFQCENFYRIARSAGRFGRLTRVVRSVSCAEGGIPLTPDACSCQKAAAARSPLASCSRVFQVSASTIS